jgi:phosphate transport system permease protein
LNLRALKDTLAERTMLLLCMSVLSLAFLMGAGLLWRSWPVLQTGALGDLLFSTQWQPAKGSFGLGAFLAGTLWVTGIAMVLAVPLSIFTAIYLQEYAPRRVRQLARPVVDVLAGISPVVYGVWGVLAIVPVVRDHVMPFFQDHLAVFPFKSENYTGYSALSGGVVLAVMVSPLIIAVTQEVIRTVPAEIREASLALGATRWETVKHTVLRKARMGIVAAVILGLSRAFGETIAVLMVSGCAMHVFPTSVFDAAYPLPALIANTYGEMMSIPLYDAAVLLAAFLLFAVTTAFNMVGWSILLRLERSER